MKLQVVDERDEQEQDGINESNGVATAVLDAPADDPLDKVATIPPEEEDTGDIEADEMHTPYATPEPAAEPAAVPTPTPAAEPIQPPTDPPAAASANRWESHVNAIREQERSIALAESEWNAAKEEAKIKKAAFDLAVSELREVIRRGPDQPSLFDQPLPASSTTTSNDIPTATFTWRAARLDSLKLTKATSKRLAKITEATGIDSAGDLWDWYECDPDRPLKYMEWKYWEKVEAAIGELQMSSSQSARESTAASTTTATAPDDDSWRSVPIVDLNSLSKTIQTKLLDAGISTLGELADWSTEYRTLADIPGIGPKKVEKIEEAMERFWAERKAD